MNKLGNSIGKNILMEINKWKVPFWWQQTFWITFITVSGRSVSTISKWGFSLASSREPCDTIKFKECTSPKLFATRDIFLRSLLKDPIWFVPSSCISESILLYHWKLSNCSLQLVDLSNARQEPSPLTTVLIYNRKNTYR